MGTKYIHRVTLACPESLIPAANQLALIVGESAGDDQTFSTPSYQDSQGNKYAVASTVVVAGFLAIPSMGLPENPSYAEEADREAAQEALDALTLWEPVEAGEDTQTLRGLMMCIDVDPQQAIAGWGLTPIQRADE